MTWSQFRQKISDSFNIDELRTLCFDLALDYEAISGDNKDAKIRELIELLRRQKRMSEFVTALEAARPNENWQEILQTTETPTTSDAKKRGAWFIAGFIILLLLISISFFSLRNNNAEPELANSLSIDAATNTPKPTPTKTAVATMTSSPESNVIATDVLLPTSTSAPRIEPVAGDKYMVLVAQLEPLTSHERDVTRFIVNDLQQNLVANSRYSEIQIREYPEVITSQKEARAVAEEVGAHIIVWGNYNDEIIETYIHVGSAKAFPLMTFDQSFLEQSGNARAHMTNERSESIAKYVLELLTFLLSASNNSATTSTAMMSEINVNSGSLVGDNVAVRLHRFADSLANNDLEGANEHLEAALEFNGGNPLVYLFKGILNARQGHLDKASEDIQTAIRIHPGNWTTPREAAGFLALFSGDFVTALDYFHQFEAGRPNDFSPPFLIGVTHFIMEDFAQAEIALDKSITLGPDVNWPHLFLLQIYLREGRLLEAIALSREILENFPDPAHGNRLLQSTVGGYFLGPLLSGMGNVLIGQPAEASLSLEQALEQSTPSADLLWMKGFAECQLGNLEMAEEYYSEAIMLDPSFILPYLSRGGTRLRLGLTEEAENDFQTIRDSELATSFAPVIPFVQSKQLTCENFLDFDPLNPPLIPENQPTAIPDATQTGIMNAPATVFSEANASSDVQINLKIGDIVEVNGRSPNDSWLYIRYENDGTAIVGFVSSKLVDYEGDISELPIQN